MPNLTSSFVVVFLSIYLLVFIVSTSITVSSSQVQQQQKQEQNPSIACKSTLYPKLCRSILSTFPFSPSDPYNNYGKFSVKQCLKQAHSFSKSINYYFTHYSKKHRGGSTGIISSALRDCLELTQLNVDYLSTISNELKSVEEDDELVDRVSSLLSGIVTNHQTCIDGLMESSKTTGIATPNFSNVTELYSVSLALVTRALNKNNKSNRKEKGGLSPTRVREPLHNLIKALHKRSCCREKGRNLADLDANGILINDTVIVSPYGTDNFTSIGEAIGIAPNNSKAEDGYFVIYVRKGYYEEYVIVPKHKKNILLIGDGINQTIITGNHSVVDGWTTFNSSTFAVSGERFVAVDITFRNTAGPEKHQAVALRNNADLSTFYRCSFEGYQDTLYVHSLRQFYRECDIYGTVDFIFGNSAAVFQNCNLYARKPLPNQKNAFTAQGRSDPNQNTGISIHNCTIRAAPDLAMDLNSTLNYLGRPWKPYSRTVYMQSFISNLIAPVGWLEWNGTVGLDTLYYGEFENYGPGANTETRVQWPGYNLMNVSDALNFTVYNFTMGDTWLPNTDIPFSAGLLG